MMKVLVPRGRLKEGDVNWQNHRKPALERSESMANGRNESCVVVVKSRWLCAILS